MTIYNQLKGMLIKVADALGEELRQQVVFVGGCATGLLLTDKVTQESVRYTDDVDLIIDIMGRAEWPRFQERLREKGFRENMDDTVICRMRLGDLKVDFMPDNPDILGFGNRWYSRAVETASFYQLTDEIRIKVIHPVYFLATKLEAYNGRGKGDPLGSHDIEDILNLVDGREELISEVMNEKGELRAYISEQFTRLLDDSGFQHSVEGQAKSDADRRQIIFERLEALSRIDEI